TDVNSSRIAATKFRQKAICRNFRQLAGNELGGSCKPARKREPISESARGPPGRPAVDPGRLSRFQEAATRLRAALAAVMTLAFSTAAGRCVNSDESGSSAAVSIPSML